MPSSTKPGTWQLLRSAARTAPAARARTPADSAPSRRPQRTLRGGRASRCCPRAAPRFRMPSVPRALREQPWPQPWACAQPRPRRRRRRRPPWLSRPSLSRACSGTTSARARARGHWPFQVCGIRPRQAGAPVRTRAPAPPAARQNTWCAGAPPSLTRARGLCRRLTPSWLAAHAGTAATSFWRRTESRRTAPRSALAVAARAPRRPRRPGSPSSP
mmetsp:Transcript_1761/g.7008  ORF Transcript_1761/g.7008 Transcript_1761/m.7008 type:complete len:216 (-) Transcript_1761:877-1524(-)